MEGVYLYCIAHAGRNPRPDLTGIGERSVTAVQSGDLAAWTERMARAPAATLESIRRHHEVIAAAVGTGEPVVPVRFGQWLGSEEALLERVAERAAEYSALLEEFRGAVEMGIRVVTTGHGREAPPPQTGPGSGGRAYMQALAREQNRRREWSALGEEIAAELRAAAGHLVLRERCEAISAPGLVSVAHLVGRSDIAAYEAALGPVFQRHSDLEFHSSGPWPPYSFAT